MYYILSLALILRLVQIGQSLWLDESLQALALMGQMGPLMTYALADFQPPLYHLILWVWTSVAGYSEITLRIPSLIAGLVTVFFAGKIGDLIGGKKLLYTASLLVATNPLLIYYSQEGRTYALTACLVTITMYYLMRLLSQRNTRDIILYTVFSALFLWTSYLTWFLHLALIVYCIYIKRKDLLYAQLVSVLTLIFWLPSLWTSLQIGLSTVATSPSWGLVVGGISFKALALTWIKATIGRISFTPPWLYAGLLIILSFLHAQVLRYVKKSSPLLYIWVGSLIIPALVSFLIPVYSYTRVLYIVPGYLIILALGLANLSRAWTYTLVASQIIALSLFWVNPSFHREDWKSLVGQYGVDATYALPSLNQSAPLKYYGVSRKLIIEPKNMTEFSNDSIVYINYVVDVFDS